jgi:hypothetical protein
LGLAARECRRVVGCVEHLHTIESKTNQCLYIDGQSRGIEILEAEGQVAVGALAIERGVEIHTVWRIIFSIVKECSI